MIDSGTHGAAVADASMWERMINALPDIIYMTTPDGVLVDGNQKYFSILKKTKEQAGGTRITDSLAREDAAMALRALKSVVENRRSERTTRTYVSGNQRLTYEVVESPILRDGDVIAIAGIGRDITQEVILEQKLWDSEEDRKSSLEFALRTSLGLVKGYIHTLESEELLNSSQRQRYRHVVIDEIEHLSKIVDDLLDFRRLEENSMPFEQVVTDIRESVDLIQRQYESEAKRREIQFVTELPEDLRPVHLAPEGVTRVLANLVQNAIHHTMHSGRVEVRVIDSDDYVEFSVTDNGPGIPEAELPFVFEKFYRGSSNAASPVQGAGMGLAVARILVTAMGGRIWVTSKPGEETTFRFVLPRHGGIAIAPPPEAENVELSDLADLSETEAI